jgi:hypothetical protein
MNKKFKSNQQIIDEVSKIVNPYMKFNMDDIYGDRGGIPYPEIEKLTILHFKYDGYNKKNFLNKNQENELIDRVKSLGVDDVQIHNYNGIGKFMAITLDSYHARIIDQYNEYLDYSNKNIERINDIYQYLEEKVPEQFVGWVLFSQK